MQMMQTTISTHGYELIDEIGRGGFARVYRVKSLVYNKIFALKVIELNNDSKSRSSAWYNETNSLKQSPHKNIISIYNFFSDEKFNYIVLDYCSNGSLRNYIKKNGPMEKQKFITIARQILEALAYLHSNGISHGDIKPDNVLFDEYNRPLLSDFGAADIINYKSPTSCSPLYAPPEVLVQKKYDPKKADMWSFGVMCYVMLVGNLPYKSKIVSDLLKLITNRDTWLSRDKTLQQITKLCLNENPNNRISAQDLLDSQLFNITKINVIPKTVVKPSLSRQLDARQFNNTKLSDIVRKESISIININNSQKNISDLRVIKVFNNRSSTNYRRLKSRSVEPSNLTFASDEQGLENQTS